jgi:hypothetical protein
MRVLCNSNMGSVLSANYLAIGNTPQSIFHVQVGREYSVFAIAVYRGAALLLLADENNLPNWYPLDLFSISEASIPSNWFSAIYQGNENGVQLLLGYEDLISDESHYNALLERDPRALEIFRAKVKSNHNQDDLS